MEKAIEIDTARPSPSGTETMMMATPVVKALISFCRVPWDRRSALPLNKMLQTKKRSRVLQIRKAAMCAYPLMTSANFLSFKVKGVSSLSSSRSSTGCSMNHLVLTPTAQTKARPLPERTKDLARRKGSGLSDWCCSLLMEIFLSMEMDPT